MRDLILENFSEFFETHTTYLESSEKLANVLTNDTIFEDFKNELLKGIDPEFEKKASELLDTHRANIISEASSMLGSSDAVAFSVASFALVLDMYATDFLAKGVYVQPSTVPTMTLSRMRVIAEKKGMDGTVKKYYIPNTEVDLRNDKVNVELENGKRVNIFNKLNVKSDEYSISSKGIRVNKIKVTVNGDANSEKEFDVPNCVFDARGNVVCEDFTIQVNDNTSAVINVTGNLNTSTGVVTLNGNVVSTEGDDTVEVTKLNLVVRLISQGGSKGFIKVRPDMVQVDIKADVDETFEIEEIEEIIQNWDAIYHKSVLDNLSAVTKSQIQINKNFEIADLLELTEPAMIKNGSYRKYDLVGDDKLAPTNIVDVFRNVIPVILQVARNVERKSGMKPNVIMAGSDIATILESLQDFVADLTKDTKTLGVATNLADIKKFTILSSPAIADNKLYILRKGITAQDSSLVELAFKPIYIINETTNGKRKTIIRSRTRTEVNKAESIGAVELQNVDKVLGTL